MAKCVLQDWVLQNCSLRMQGVLVIALRGPDGAVKESKAKPIVRTIRALVMNSGREGKPMELGTGWKTDPFMTMKWISHDIDWDEAKSNFFGDMDSYNLHFFQHLIHAMAIIGMYHPHQLIRVRCWHFYTEACNRLHVVPENYAEIEYRLRDGIREGEEEE
jgi:hypothetical protein